MFDHKSGYFFGEAAKLWWVFIVAGLFAWISPLLVHLDVSNLRVAIIGLIAIIIGTILKLNYFGLQIDQSNNRIRNYTTFLGIKTGVWQKSPQVIKITVTSKNVSTWNTPNGISPTYKSNTVIYTIALFSISDNPDFFIQTDNKNIAMLKAEQLSKLYKIQVEKY